MSFRISARKRQPIPERLPSKGILGGVFATFVQGWAYSERLVELTGLIHARRPRQPFFTTLRQLMEEGQDLTLGTLVARAGEQTYGLLILLLALPSLIPGLNLGAAPLGGSAIAALGLQMMRGISSPSIPPKVRDLPIHKGRVKEALAKVERLLLRFSKRKARRELNRKWMGFAVLLQGVLLALPVPLAFGNIAPAFALCLLGAALMEEQSVWAWIAGACSLAVSLYFALSFNLVIMACVGTWHMLTHLFS